MKYESGSFIDDYQVHLLLGGLETRGSPQLVNHTLPFDGETFVGSNPTGAVKYFAF